MITLPLATTAAKTATTAAKGAAADSTEIGADIGSASSGTADGASSENAGFLTLLGNKLLTLAQQGQTALPASATAAAAADDKETGSPKAKLNALLAALDKPETLNALLQPAKTTDQDKTGATADASENSDAAAATTLSNNDMQALQALFAMLPPTQQQPAATVAKASDTLSEGSIKGGSANATLASLLSGANANANGSEETAKGSDKSSQLSGSSTLNTTNSAAATQKSDATAATLNSAFQQVLGQVSKDNDKENSSSTTQTTITPSVISAASAAVTPATSSLVTAPATPQLNSQLGSPEWQQALGQQIVMFSRNGQQTAELHLHPQDLGSIQISLKLDSDQAQLSMVSNHSQVRAALEAAMPQLREALAQNGINLGQTNVSSDAFQQGQSFSGQQEQQRDNSRGNTFSLTAENDSDVTPIAVPAALQARASGSNAVDIFA